MTDTTPEATDTPAERASGGTDGETTPRAAVETSVPAGVDAVECERCGRPFESASSLTLHRGLAHEADLSADEREAFRTAYEAETDDIRRFRIVALGALVLLYFGLLFAYAVFA